MDRGKYERQRTEFFFFFSTARSALTQQNDATARLPLVVAV